MIKIRDLGVDVIQACSPGTKAPPGGGCFAASGNKPHDDDKRARPGCQHSKKGPPKPSKVNAYGSHLGEEAVVLLRSQLHDVLGNRIAI